MNFLESFISRYKLDIIFKLLTYFLLYFQRIATSELGGDLLGFLGVKSDTSDGDVEALRKLVDNVVDTYTRQAATAQNSFSIADVEKYIDVSFRSYQRYLHLRNFLQYY